MLACRYFARFSRKSAWLRPPLALSGRGLQSLEQMSGSPSPSTSAATASWPPTSMSMTTQRREWEGPLLLAEGSIRVLRPLVALAAGVLVPGIGTRDVEIAVPVDVPHADARVDPWADVRALPRLARIRRNPVPAQIVAIAEREHIELAIAIDVNEGRLAVGGPGQVALDELMAEPQFAAPSRCCQGEKHDKCENCVGVFHGSDDET